jgi:hypothetical protein
VLLFCAVCKYAILHIPAIHSTATNTATPRIPTLPLQYTVHTTNPPLSLYPSLSLLLSQSVVVGRSRCNNCDTANAVTRTYYRSIQASQPDRHVPCLHASLTHVLSRLSTHIPTHTQTRRSPSACPASPVLLVLGGKVRCPCVCVLSAWLSWHTPGGLHSGGQTR